MQWMVMVLGVVMFAGLLVSAAHADAGFLPRVYYGAKLEPVSGVLHGAGQVHFEDVEAYMQAIAPHRPVVFMAYFNLRGDAASYGQRLRETLDRFPSYTVVQMGLSMTSDGQPHLHYEHEVADGMHDEKIDAFVQMLGGLGVPVYLRVGYECNGPWNGYVPGPFRKAFRRVAQRVRDADLEAAIIWNPHPHDLETALPYYPGDEWVDWWAVDLFGTHEIEACKPLLALAHEAGKPVMIGESTPHTVGVRGGQESWDGWFAPYFELIRTQPGIKAFCYINWDWTIRPKWANWGDARLQENAVVAEHYRREMELPLYLHSSTEASFRAALRPAPDADADTSGSE
jgi:hypothetical protein